MQNSFNELINANKLVRKWKEEEEEVNMKRGGKGKQGKKKDGNKILLTRFNSLEKNRKCRTVMENKLRLSSAKRTW